MQASDPEHPRVGFVGTGTMGAAMVECLLDRGIAPALHDVNPDSAAPLVARGARFVAAPDELAADCDVVLLSLPGPREVESVVRGPEGLLRGLGAGSVIADLSTSSVELARSLAACCAEREVAFLDAPVSGGARGAREGTLVLMVGGEAAALERVRPVLERLARAVFHLGPSGAGSVAKLVNNQLYLAGQVIFYEGLALAAKAGLDLQVLVEVLGATGSGGVHAQLADRLFERRFDDRTFVLGLAQKDLALALDAGRALAVPLPTTAAAHQLFVEGAAAGLQDKNFWAAAELVERRAGTRITKGGA